MGRATKTELLWAYAITREEFLKRVNDKIELHPKDWEDIRDTLFEAMSKGESGILQHQVGDRKNEWSSTTIDQILSNEKYVGQVLIVGSLGNAHEQIIGREAFARAQGMKG